MIEIDSDSYTEGPPEASEPERAWVEGFSLCIHIHEYNKEWKYRVDKDIRLSLIAISSVEIHLGPKDGFKGITIHQNNSDNGQDYKISKSHEELTKEICKIIKDQGKPVNTNREEKKKRSS